MQKEMRFLVMIRRFERIAVKLLETVSRGP
jgi:hypothetical protein